MSVGKVFRFFLPNPFTLTPGPNRFLDDNSGSLTLLVLSSSKPSQFWVAHSSSIPYSSVPPEPTQLRHCDTFDVQPSQDHEGMGRSKNKLFKLIDQREKKTSYLCKIKVKHACLFCFVLF